LKLLLASASPRRAELLRECGINFEIITAEVAELSGGDDLSLLPELNARLKAGAVADIHRDKLVLGADTMILFENRAMGKPADLSDAREMLRTFSGKTHQVYTGVCVLSTADGCATSKSDVTHVTFRNLSEQEIDAYVATGECDDKAGAYAIQGLGARYIEYISGDYYSVVGLPVRKLYKTLSDMQEL
jgi:septum formation protein